MEDFYADYTKKFKINVVKEVAQYLSDRFPMNYSILVVELCKMFCNQNYDTHFEIDEDIKKLPFMLN